MVERTNYECFYSYGKDESRLDRTKDCHSTKQRRHYFNPTHASMSSAPALWVNA